MILVLVLTGAAVADEPGILRVFSHGEGVYGRLQPDGSMIGAGPDQLACVSATLGIPYSLNPTSMPRSKRLIAKGLLDIWFPTYDTGEDHNKDRLVGHLGDMSLYFFMRKDTRLLPDSPEFWEKARITAFPGSYPERYIRERAKHPVKGPDNVDKMMIALLAGEFDALYAADIRQILSEGIERRAAGRIGLILDRKMPVAFEVTAEFANRHATFMPRLKAAFADCSTARVIR